MNVNEKVYDSINNLTNTQKMHFGIFCAERIIELYKYFDEMVKTENLKQLIPNENGYNILRNILNYIENGINENESYKINNYIKICASLMPDYDEYGGDYETIVAQYIGRAIGFLLEFYNTKDNKFINWCSDNIIEVINAVESYKYRKSNENINNEERRKYIEKCYEEEIKLELNFIKLLKNNIDKETMEKYINENKIGIK
jgi:hypothetical protein